MDKPKVTIYTDGAAEPNPGPGGWGAVLLLDGTVHQRDLKGGNVQTTNNRMEITAAIEALKALKQPCVVELFTDSEYLKNGITAWMPNWKKTNFKKGKIQNSDLWQLLDAEAARHEIAWHWVKGHANSEYNERADTLAAMGRAEALGRPVNEDGLNPHRVYVTASALGKSGTWAALLKKGEQQTTLSGSESQTTANRLFLLAAIAGLEAIPEQEAVQVFTNNDYLRHGIRGWVKGWKRNGWRTQDGSEVKNRDLWEKLDQLTEKHDVKWSDVEDNIPELKTLAETLKQAGTSTKSG